MKEKQLQQLGVVGDWFTVAGAALAFQIFIDKDKEKDKEKLESLALQLALAGELLSALAACCELKN